MKTLTKLMAVLAILGFVNVAMAADDAAPKADKPNKAAKADKAKPGKPTGKVIKGQVVSVDGSTLKIKTGGKKAEQKEVTVTTDASTKVVIEGKQATLADLKPGQKINILHANQEGTGPAVRVAVPAPKSDKAAGKTEKAADKDK